LSVQGIGVSFFHCQNSPKSGRFEEGIYHEVEKVKVRKRKRDFVYVHNFRWQFPGIVLRLLLRRGARQPAGDKDVHSALRAVLGGRVRNFVKTKLRPPGYEHKIAMPR
jgi:hypothetical protein